MTTTYRIGETQVGLKDLQSLTTPVPYPMGPFQPFAEPQPLWYGGVRGGGAPVVEWRWGFLTRAQRDQLRTFCTGASAEVYITTKTNDNTDEYKDYSCVMTWPVGFEERQAGRRLEFVITFTNLVEVT